jgi:hypothetical protein
MGISFIKYAQNLKMGISFIKYAQNLKMGISFIKYAQNLKIGKPNDLKFVGSKTTKGPNRIANIS